MALCNIAVASILVNYFLNANNEARSYYRSYVVIGPILFISFSKKSFKYFHYRSFTFYYLN
jgi:hypothetical protein